MDSKSGSAAVCSRFSWRRLADSSTDARQSSFKPCRALTQARLYKAEAHVVGPHDGKLIARFKVSNFFKLWLKVHQRSRNCSFLHLRDRRKGFLTTRSTAFEMNVNFF